MRQQVAVKQPYERVDAAQSGVAARAGRRAPGWGLGLLLSSIVAIMVSYVVPPHPYFAVVGAGAWLVAVYRVHRVHRIHVLAGGLALGFLVWAALVATAQADQVALEQLAVYVALMGSLGIGLTVGEVVPARVIQAVLVVFGCLWAVEVAINAWTEWPDVTRALLGTRWARSNTLAGIEAMIVPLGISRVLATSGLVRVAWLCGTVTTALVPLFFVSRGGILALAVSLITMTAILPKKSRRLLSWWVVGLGLAVVVVVMAEVVHSPGDMVDVLLRVMLDPNGRLGLWAAALVEVWDNPLLGGGLRAFDPHNVALDVALNVGVPGALLFLALMFGLIAYTWKATSRTGAPVARSVRAAFVAAVLGAAVHSLLEPRVTNLLSGSFFWMYLGITVSVTSVRETPYGNGADSSIDV